MGRGRYPIISTVCLFIVLMLLPAAVRAAATYDWSGGATGDWQVAANWTPPRSAPAGDDILRFGGGGSVTATNLSDENCGQLLITNGTAVTLQAGNLSIVTINGDAGTDLEVAAGSSLNLGGSKAIEIILESGATGTIGGSMTVGGAPHRLDARDSGAITVAAGATVTQAALCTGALFDVSTTPGTVVFAAGSTFVSRAGGNPFKLTQPDSKVVFQSGSLYRHEQNGSPSFSGRSYGNFELKSSAAVNSGTGTGPCSMDGLTVTSGSLTTVFAGPLTIRGNIAVAAGGTLNFSPAAPATLTLGGSVPQGIGGAGVLTFGAGQGVVIANPSGVTLQTDVSLTDLTIATGGRLTAPAGTLAVSGNFTNNGTFVPNSGTVVLNGADQAISGSGTFSNLTKIASGVATLTFAAGETQTVAGTLRLQGSAGGLLSLRSSAPGTQWRIDPRGGRTLSYLDVRDAGNINSAILDAAGTGSVDSGNNTNWRFVFPPAAPVATAADPIGQNGFTARWNASAGAAGYRLDVAEDGAFTIPVAGYSDRDVGPVTLQPVSGLAGGRHYHYRVRGYNGGGVSGNSNSIAITTTLAPAIISAGEAGLTYGSAGAFTITAVGYPVPALTVSGTLPAGVVVTDNGNGSVTLNGTPKGAGSFPLTVTAANGAGPAAVQPFTLTVGKGVQWIDFHPLSTVPLGTPDFSPSATASSGLPVAYASNNRNVAVIVNGKVRVVGAGTAVITATQEGDATWQSASLSRSLSVVPSADLPTVAISTLSDGAVTTAPILNVSGTADSPNGVDSVRVNGTEAPLDGQGGFSVPLRLVTGSNDLVVTVADRAGQQTVVARTVVLDGTAPGLRVKTPSDGSVEAAPRVAVAGTVDDRASVVSWSVNGGTRHAAEPDGTSFGFFADLAPGMNTIEVIATQADGRVSRVKRTVFSRPDAFPLAVTTPPMDSRSGRTTFTIGGTLAGDAVSVSVTDAVTGTGFSAPVNGGAFSQQLTLATEGNHPVTVTAVDRSGSSVSVTRTMLHARLGCVTNGESVSMVDALVALQMAVGILVPTEDQLLRGDVAPLVEGVPMGDGRIDIEDVLVILHMALELNI